MFDLSLFGMNKAVFSLTGSFLFQYEKEQCSQFTRCVRVENEGNAFVCEISWAMQSNAGSSDKF